MLVGVIDTGLGTIASMLNMLRRAGADVEATTDPSSLDRFSHLVLPGVGHFTEGTRRLHEQGWTTPVRDYAAGGRPVLGVCLGMQLLGETSEEGPGEGLGLLPFSLRKLESAPGRPVPHMGWNTVEDAGSPLLTDEEDRRFYFVHSYAIDGSDPVVLGRTAYGEPFGSVVGRDNVHGAQFHPEKSHRFGMRLLQNFIRMA